MTIDDFKDILQCNEPEFSYRGGKYSICCPDGRYYVTASDSLSDTDLVFESVDDLFENWRIQGRLLRDIVPEISMGW